MNDDIKSDLRKLAASVDQAAREANVEAEIVGFPSTLTPDEPIQSSSADRLNRSGFAEQLARAVTSLRRTESVVIGIYGKWGTGKTSLLNLVEEYLQRDSEQPPVIYRFNPWGFSDQQQLTERFFSDLAVFLQLHISLPPLAGVSETVEEYGELLSPMAGMLFPRATDAAKAGWKIFRRFRPAKRKTATELKARINSALEQAGTKLIIMVDDIDRLNATEIRQVFQLIKLNANFSNTVYLVAFDKTPVERALKEVSPGPPAEYLEKIVQVVFNLPPIPDATLSGIVLGNFNEMLAGVPQVDVDQQRFGNMFNSGFRSFFRTIRDVNRFFNLFKFAFNLMRYDTDFVDLAAIEGIALFYPQIYQLIQENSDLFSGTWGLNESQHVDKAVLRSRYDKIFQKVSDSRRASVISLCGFLFPKMEYSYGRSNSMYGPDWEATWQRSRRIASTKYFSYYFQLAVPDTDVSKAQFDIALESADSVPSFVDALRNFKATDRFGAFLDLLRDQLSSINPAKLRVILGSIFVFADNLSTETVSMFGIASEHIRFAHWALYDILDRLPTGERFRTLITCMRGAPAIFTVTDVTASFDSVFKKDSEPSRKKDRYPDLTIEVVDEMKSAALDVIHHAAVDGRLRSAPHLPFVLFRWKEWENPEAPVAWVRSNYLTSPKGAVSLLRDFLVPVTSMGLNDKVPKIQMTIQLQPLAQFVDLSTLADLVTATPDSELDDKDQLAKRRFLAAKAKLDAGMNPDHLPPDDEL